MDMLCILDSLFFDRYNFGILESRGILNMLRRGFVLFVFCD